MVFLGIQRANEVMKSKAIATVLKMIAALPEENLFGIGAVSQGRKRLLIGIGEDATVKKKFEEAL